MTTSHSSNGSGQSRLKRPRGAAALAQLLAILLLGVSLGGCGSAAAGLRPTTGGPSAVFPAAAIPGAAVPAPAAARPAVVAAAPPPETPPPETSPPAPNAAPAPTAAPTPATAAAAPTAPAADAATRNRRPLAGMVIVVDPGHGGSQANGGATGITGLKEKDSNLWLGLELRDALTQAGARVIMTRTGDASPVIPGHPELDQLLARTYIAAHSGANLFISLHGNWSPDPNVSGLETYYYPGSQAGRRLAEDMLWHISQAVDITPHFATSARYAVLHHHPVTAVLLELGYVSNAVDEAHLRSPSFRTALVRGIVAGATQFLTGSAG